jgi:hypothetical protein
MKKIKRVMQKYSKEGNMVNHNLRKLLKIHLQEYHPCSRHKESSTVGRLVVVIDVNPSHGFWTRRLMKLFGHEGK